MKNLKKLFPYLRRYKKRIYIGFIFVTISNICSTYLPRIVGETVDTIGSSGFSQDFILKQIAYILLLTLGSGLFMFLTRQTIIYASRLIEYDLRFDYMNVVMFQPLSFFQENSIGSLMALATNDIPAAREFLGPAVMYAANTLTTFLFASYFMFSLNIEMTLVALLPLPFITLSTYYLGRKVHIASKAVQDEYANLTRQSQETISGVRIIRAYNRQNYERKLFSDISRDYMNKNLKLARLQSLFAPAMAVLVGISFVLVLGYGGYLVINHRATLGDLTQFFIYLTLLIWPVAAIGYITNIIQRASASAVRLSELYDKTISQDAENGGANGDTTISAGEITFENVSHTHNGSSANSLNNINLNIAAGTSIGIVGPVGSGKSTIANLIPRLYSPSEGSIKIDGIDIEAMSLKKLRQSISYVPQETFLFSMSLRDNLRFGNPEASEADIIEAAKAAELHSEVMSLERGYDTILGERGITLSGGQRQRTAIARALLRKPKILILDDALSAVDASTEEKILSNLKKYILNQTTIIISHRISSVRNADNIIAISDGKIIEMGTSDELLALDGYYANIYKKQLLEEEIANA